MQKRNALFRAGFACLLSLILMFTALFLTTPKASVFTPPSFEAAAVPGIPTVSESLGWAKLDAEAYQVFICSRLAFSDESADCWLTNPIENTVWLKLRILDESGNLLGQTGIIRPGEYVRSVDLSVLPMPGQPFLMKIMAYEPETYHSAGSVVLRSIRPAE